FASRGRVRGAGRAVALLLSGRRVRGVLIRRIEDLMPAEIPADAPNREAMFPTLTPAQVARIAPLAHERSLRDGERLWAQGDRNRPVYVVIEGEIEILSGADHLVTVHAAGNFSGDVDILSGRPVVVGARAR